MKKFTRKSNNLAAKVRNSTAYQVFSLIFLIGVWVFICYTADGIQKKELADRQLLIDQQQEIQDLKAQIKKECCK